MATAPHSVLPLLDEVIAQDSRNYSILCDPNNKYLTRIQQGDDVSGVKKKFKIKIGGLVKIGGAGEDNGGSGTAPVVAPTMLLTELRRRYSLKAERDPADAFTDLEAGCWRLCKEIRQKLVREGSTEDRTASSSPGKWDVGSGFEHELLRLERWMDRLLNPIDTEKGKLLHVLDALMRAPESDVFRDHPTKSINRREYLKKIDTPMCLYAAYDRVRHHYPPPEEQEDPQVPGKELEDQLMRDLELIYENSKAWNKDTSSWTVGAKKLRGLAVRKLKGLNDDSTDLSRLAPEVDSLLMHIWGEGKGNVNDDGPRKIEDKIVEVAAPTQPVEQKKPTNNGKAGGSKKGKDKQKGDEVNEKPSTTKKKASSTKKPAAPIPEEEDDIPPPPVKVFKIKLGGNRVEAPTAPILAVASSSSKTSIRLTGAKRATPRSNLADIIDSDDALLNILGEDDDEVRRSDDGEEAPAVKARGVGDERQKKATKKGGSTLPPKPKPPKPLRPSNAEKKLAAKEAKEEAKRIKLREKMEAKEAKEAAKQKKRPKRRLETPSSDSESSLGGSSSSSGDDGSVSDSSSEQDSVPRPTRRTTAPRGAAVQVQPVSPVKHQQKTRPVAAVAIPRDDATRKQHANDIEAEAEEVLSRMEQAEYHWRSAARVEENRERHERVNPEDRVAVHGFLQELEALELRLKQLYVGMGQTSTKW